jgi:hypothetical protein
MGGRVVRGQFLNGGRRGALAFAALRVHFPPGAEVLEEMVFLDEMFFLAQLLAEKVPVWASSLGGFGGPAWRFQGREELQQFFFKVGPVFCLVLSSFVIFIVFGGRTGLQGFVPQGLVQVGDDLGAGGQEAVPGGGAGRGEQAIGGIQFQGDVHLIDLVNEAAADMGAFINPVGVVVSGGSLNPGLDMVQEGAEFEEGDLFQVIFQALQGPGHFFLQVPAMAVEGRAAGAEILAELVQGVIPGEDGQVDFMNDTELRTNR